MIHNHICTTGSLGRLNYFLPTPSWDYLGIPVSRISIWCAVLDNKSVFLTEKIRVVTMGGCTPNTTGRGRYAEADLIRPGCLHHHHNSYKPPASVYCYCNHNLCNVATTPLSPSLAILLITGAYFVYSATIWLVSIRYLLFIFSEEKAFQIYFTYVKTHACFAVIGVFIYTLITYWW